VRAWRKKLWQLLDLRNKGTFHRIIERMEATMKMEGQAIACKAPFKGVNAVMDLKRGRHLRTQASKKLLSTSSTGAKRWVSHLICCSNQCHVALAQV
jgi:hypothetical protein